MTLDSFGGVALCIIAPKLVLSRRESTLSADLAILVSYLGPTGSAHGLYMIVAKTRLRESDELAHVFALSLHAQAPHQVLVPYSQVQHLVFQLLDVFVLRQGPCFVLEPHSRRRQLFFQSLDFLLLTQGRCFVCQSRLSLTDNQNIPLKLIKPWAEAPLWQRC